MINAVSDYQLFTRLWNRFTEYALKNGIEHYMIYKALAGRNEPEEAIKVAACLNHWINNIANEQDQADYVKAFKKEIVEEVREAEEEFTL
jgi:hypothetical protein